MEEKKNKTKLSTFIIVLAVLVIIIMAGFIYMQKVSSDREIAGLKSDAEGLKATVTELQGKLGAASDILGTEESNKEVTTASENQFSVYQSNFEKSYKNVIAKYEGEPGIEGEIKTDQMARIPSRGGVMVKSNGDAYYGKTQSVNDMTQKIDTNVASVHYCSVGQDSGDIVLIHRDGTVSIIKDVLYPDTKIEPTKIEKVENIISVIQILEYDEIDGGDTYYLVDINGNIIDVNR